MHSTFTEEMGGDWISDPSIGLQVYLIFGFLKK